MLTERRGERKCNAVRKEISKNRRGNGGKVGSKEERKGASKKGKMKGMKKGRQ